MPKVGDIIDAENASWHFGGKVSRHFDQHARRSIPYYESSHALTFSLSDFFLGDGTVVYDLGCATGTLLDGLAKRHHDKSVRFIGIDAETDMTAVARQRNAGDSRIEILHADIVDFEFAPCDLIVANYTMQFVAPRWRQLLLDRLYRALNWGGALILFEKVRAPDARFQDMMTAIYNDYKLEQGYSGDEILAKARSLKGVLEPFSREGNLGLLQRAGFVDIMSVFKYVCFEGFLAIK